MSQSRRSLQHSAAPDELGQHCRAGYLSDRLAEIVLDAAVARYLLDIGADDEAILLLERVVANFREAAKTARVFRDVHADQAVASANAARAHAAAVHAASGAAVDQERDALGGPSSELLAEAAREYRNERAGRRGAS